ncbi:MAG: four-carbon acid sugar kinase family protein [Thermoproteota archaeon]
MRFGVIADDLTGAFDTGLEFRKKGLKTIVLTSTCYLKRHSRKVDVAVVDTSGRLSSPRIARMKAAEAASKLKKHGAKYFYKKVDSTLRGNVVVEIEAVMDELNVRTAVFTPALPEQGRTVVGGHLLVDGKRLAETDFARDPITPVIESHIPTLIEKSTDKKVGSIPLSSIRGNLEREFMNLQEEGVNIIVADATTRKDLRRIAESIEKTGLAKLSCGSAGLAAELPAAFGFYRSPLPAIVLSGSSNPVTQAQIKKVEETLEPYVAKLNAFRLSSGSHRPYLNKKLKEAMGAIDDGRDTILCLDVVKGLSKARTRKVLTSFRSIVLNIAKDGKDSGLIMVGGETTAQACGALGADAMVIEDEVDLGLACARIIDGEYRGMRIITKAGGFGDEYALLRAINFLKMRRR